MAKMIINGEVCSGSTNYASAIDYTEPDGTKSTVQNAIDDLNSKLKNDVSFVFNEDGSIKGYKTPLGGADTVFPFKSASDKNIEYVFWGTRGLPSGGKFVGAAYLKVDGLVTDSKVSSTTTYATSISANITLDEVGTMTTKSTSGTSHSATFTANKDLVCDILTNGGEPVIGKKMTEGETYTSTFGQMTVIVYSDNKGDTSDASVESAFYTAVPPGKYLKMSWGGNSTISDLSNSFTFTSYSEMIICNVTDLGYTNVSLTNNISAGGYIRLIRKDGTTSTGTSTLKSCTLYDTTAYVIITGSASNSTVYTATFT